MEKEKRDYHDIIVLVCAVVVVVIELARFLLDYIVR
jgi:hypothetical protein